MVSPVGPVTAPVAELVHGSQPVVTKVQDAHGNTLPPARQTLAAPTHTTVHDTVAAVEILNKFSNTSGLPNQYRVAPLSDNKLIQELNPATGAVLGEFPVSEFPALAASIGLTVPLVDTRA